MVFQMKPELLEAVSRQPAMAAIAQGVVEWSGQSLLSLAKPMAPLQRVAGTPGLECCLFNQSGWKIGWLIGWLLIME